jgi:hypothetical protein
MRNCEGEGTTGVCRSSHGSSNRKDDSDQSTIGYLNLLLAALQRNCELERSVLAIRLVITGSWVRLESRMLSLKVNISKVHMSLTERAKRLCCSASRLRLHFCGLRCIFPLCLWALTSSRYLSGMHGVGNRLVERVVTNDRAHALPISYHL